MSTIIILLCLLPLAVVFFFVYRYYLYRKALNTIPGSEDVNLLTKDAKFKSNLYNLIQNHEKDGIFKVNIDNKIHVIISEKELIRDFLCPSNSKCVKKGDTVCPFKSLISFPDSEEWKSRRRLMTCSFHFRSVSDLNSRLEQLSFNLINTFTNNNNLTTISCPVINIREMVTGIVLDTIFETLLCHKLSKSKKRDDIIKLFANELISLKSLSWFEKKLNSEKERMKRLGLQSLNEVINEVFESRVEQLINKNNKNNCLSLDQDNDDDFAFGFTLIDSLIRQHLSGNFTTTDATSASGQQKRVESNKLSKQSILAEVTSIIITGVEPVCKTLTLLFLHLANEPTIVQKMRMEIDEKVKKNAREPLNKLKEVQTSLKRMDTGHDVDGDVSWKSIKKIDNKKLKMAIIDTIPLIDSSIREVLKMHPPVEFMARKVVDSGLTMTTPTMTTCNVPSGVTVIVCPFGNRHQDERMKDDEEGRSKLDTLLPLLNLDGKKRGPKDTFSFGAGIRSCIGERFALQLLQMLTFEFVTNFNISFDTKDNNLNHLVIKRVTE